MGLKRKLVREAVVNLLKADSTLIALVPAAQIFESRVETVWRSELPVIAVYTKNESADDFNQYDRVMNRTLELAVEIVVEGTQDLDDDLDEIADAVENVLLHSQNLVNSGLWQSISMNGFQTAYSGESGKAVGAGRMEFEIEYQTIFD
jgi:hypothetical protein